MTCQKTYRKADPEFIASLNELARALNYPLERLFWFSSLDILRFWAGLKLVSKAGKVLDIERVTFPGDPARTEAMQHLKDSYRIFNEWRLIEDVGYGLYFTRAKKQKR